MSFAVTGAQPIPFSQRQDVEKLLNDMVARGFIMPVTDPSDWVHLLVERTCVNLDRLYKFFRCPTHLLLSNRDAIESISGSVRYCTTAGASLGY